MANSINLHMILRSHEQVSMPCGLRSSHEIVPLSDSARSMRVSVYTSSVWRIRAWLVLPTGTPFLYLNNGNRFLKNQKCELFYKYINYKNTMEMKYGYLFRNVMFLTNTSLSNNTSEMIYVHFFRNVNFHTNRTVSIKTSTIPVIV